MVRQHRHTAFRVFMISTSFSAMAVFTAGCGKDSSASASNLNAPSVPVPTVANATTTGTTTSGATTTGTIATAPAPVTVTSLQQPLYSLQDSVSSCGTSLGSYNNLLQFLLQAYQSQNYQPLAYGSGYSSLPTSYGQIYNGVSGNTNQLNCMNSLGGYASQMGNYSNYYSPGALTNWMQRLLAYHYTRNYGSTSGSYGSSYGYGYGSGANTSPTRNYPY